MIFRLDQYDFPNLIRQGYVMDITNLNLIKYFENKKEKKKEHWHQC